MHFPHGRHAHIPPLVDQIERWPVAVAQRIPIGAVVVEIDGMRQSEFLGDTLHFSAVFFPVELRGVDADDVQALRCVLFMNPVDPREAALAVDSTRGVHLEQNHLASEAGGSNGCGIQPRVRAAVLKFGH